jgi:acetyl esterase/lipase
MPSWQLHFFASMMRLARLGQANFPVDDAKAFARFRTWADRAANLFLRPPRQVGVAADHIAGVRGEWLIPAEAPESPVLIFLHGGGILFGWNNPLRREAAYIAKFSGLRAFGVDYRLAPEFRYPVAHDECYAVYTRLLEQGKEIILVGESSGAVLALSILLRARSAGLSQPLLCALISPVVDYGFGNFDARKYQDAFAQPKFALELHKHYVDGNDTMLPDLSPIYADLSGVAPLYIMAGESEILRPEADRLIEAAQRYEVPIQVVLWPEVFHSWHALAPELPEAVRALENLGAAIRRAAPGAAADGRQAGDIQNSGLRVRMD